MILAGYAVGIAISLGLQLPFTEAQIADAISIIIFIILAYADARYPNNLIEKATPQTKIEVTTDELATAIQKASDETEQEDEETDDVVDEDDQQ